MTTNVMRRGDHRRGRLRASGLDPAARPSRVPADRGRVPAADGATSSRSTQGTGLPVFTGFAGDVSALQARTYRTQTSTKAVITQDPQHPVSGQAALGRIHRSRPTDRRTSGRGTRDPGSAALSFHRVAEPAQTDCPQPEVTPMLLDLIAPEFEHAGAATPLPLVRPGALLRGAPRGRGASEGALHRLPGPRRPAWPAPSSGASRGASGAASSSSRASSCRASGRGDVRARTRWPPDVGAPRPAKRPLQPD